MVQDQECWTNFIISLFADSLRNLCGCKAFFGRGENFPPREGFWEKGCTPRTRNIFQGNLEEWTLKYGLWNINVPILHIIMCLLTFWDCVECEENMIFGPNVCSSRFKGSKVRNLAHWKSVWLKFKWRECSLSKSFITPLNEECWNDEHKLRHPDVQMHNSSKYFKTPHFQECYNV